MGDNASKLSFYFKKGRPLMTSRCEVSSFWPRRWFIFLNYIIEHCPKHEALFFKTHISSQNKRFCCLFQIFGLGYSAVQVDAACNQLYL
jgi:hypothetical protein